MLVLNRKFGESIIIADDITVTPLEAYGYEIELGIVVPKNLPVRHEGIYTATQEEYIGTDDMLLLMCAIGEIITIGDDIRVVVISAYGCQVKVGIKAPKDISIYRDEIYERILEE